MLSRGILVNISLVLAEGVEALEELATLITINGVGMRVMSSNHMKLQLCVRFEVSPTDLAYKLDLNPLHYLAVQRILLLLKMVGTEVSWPASRIFLDHLVTERTLEMFQFRVLIVEMFL